MFQMGSSVHSGFLGQLFRQRRTRGSKVRAHNSNYLAKNEGQFVFCSICERITPRLAHANAAVVLSAIKVLMKLMEMLPKDSDFLSTIGKKLAPPLVTLLSMEPEIQYVALRNINLIVQKR